MSRVDTAQLNIRSRFARERVEALTLRTGMTATQVVEEALRAYSPPVSEEESLPPELKRKGLLLVARSTGRVITLEEADAAMDAAREERALDVEG